MSGFVSLDDDLAQKFVYRYLGENRAIYFCKERELRYSTSPKKNGGMQNINLEVRVELNG